MPLAVTHFTNSRREGRMLHLLANALIRALLESYLRGLNTRPRGGTAQLIRHESQDEAGLYTSRREFQNRCRLISPSRFRSDE
jgi:hypothetical protein